MTAPVPITWGEKLYDEDKITYPSEDSAEFYRKDLPPGMCEMFPSLDGKAMSLRYVCPCGCGRLRIVPSVIGEKVERRWLWNGNKEKPTLTPSIACRDGCKWHGFITDGVFTTC
jgi:hypothetical protein